MEFAKSIIWFLFVGACVVLAYFFLKRFRELKKKQIAQQALYDEKKEKYSHITSEMFDDIPLDELTHAVIFQIMAKEDEYYDQEELVGQFVDNLTHGEKLIYTIYQVENSLQGGKGSIHSFFITEPYCQCRPYYKEAYETIHCHEISTLLQAAEHLAILIENDQEDQIDEDSDYATYNFSDFTNELIAMIRSGGVMEKCNQYIKEHKDDFINLNQEGEEKDEERISE